MTATHDSLTKADRRGRLRFSPEHRADFLKVEHDPFQGAAADWHDSVLWQLIRPETSKHDVAGILARHFFGFALNREIIRST